jgi:hypothetical protein
MAPGRLFNGKQDTGLQNSSNTAVLRYTHLQDIVFRHRKGSNLSSSRRYHWQWKRFLSSSKPTISYTTMAEKEHHPP